jgi:uncharacterized membrane protein
VGTSLLEWLHLALRWTHVLAAVSWIGNSFYFMWLDRSLEKPAAADENLDGTLWMVHSGGFYRVEKRRLAPGGVPPVLHWFKWEALLTAVSGLALLLLVYHWGQIVVDAGETSMSAWAALGIAVAFFVVAWVVYDRLWISPLVRRPALAVLVSYGLLVLSTWGLRHVYGGRATFLHVGAMLGTLMVNNVWMRILPAQREMIAAAKAGRPRDATLARRAKQRSVHNSYMTLPVVFLMLSPHFPSTYGHRHAWVVFAVAGLAGAAFRHFMIAPSRRTVWLAAGAVASLAALAVWTS